MEGSVPKVLVGLFLIAHGLVHALYFAPAEPDYPMTAAKSWLVTRVGLGLQVVRPLVAVLAVAALAGFGLLALSHWGLLVPAAWFKALATVSALLSLLLIAVTWDKSFVVGTLINVGVLYWALR
jgi:hypothetical protein